MVKCHGLEISYVVTAFKAYTVLFCLVWDNLKVELKKAYDRRNIIIA